MEIGEKNLAVQPSFIFINPITHNLTNYHVKGAIMTTRNLESPSQHSRSYALAMLRFASTEFKRFRAELDLYAPLPDKLSPQCKPGLFIRVGSSESPASPSAVAHTALGNARLLLDEYERRTDAVNDASRVLSASSAMRRIVLASICSSLGSILPWFMTTVQGYTGSPSASNTSITGGLIVGALFSGFAFEYISRVESSTAFELDRAAKFSNISMVMLPAIAGMVTGAVALSFGALPAIAAGTLAFAGAYVIDRLINLKETALYASGYSMSPTNTTWSEIASRADGTRATVEGNMMSLRLTLAALGVKLSPIQASVGHDPTYGDIPAMCSTYGLVIW